MEKEPRRPRTAQEQQDAIISKMVKTPPTPEQVAAMKAYLAKGGSPSSHNPSSPDCDPIAVAMAANPGLTRDEAEEFSREFGF